MPVEFLSDDEVAAYGRFTAAPSRADLERVFFLNDEDRALVAVRRGEYSQLGFALQLVTVRWLGTFLEDPVDVPVVVLDFVAEQLGVDDSSRVQEYTRRCTTSFEHQLTTPRTPRSRRCSTRSRERSTTRSEGSAHRERETTTLLGSKATRFWCRR